MKHRQKVFGGLLPKVEPALLGEQSAQEAENCNLASGVINPAKHPTNIPEAQIPEGLPGTVKSLYKFNDELIAEEGYVRFARSPVHNDMYNRLYTCGKDGGPTVIGGTTDSELFDNGEIVQIGDTSLSYGDFLITARFANPSNNTYTPSEPIALGVSFDLDDYASSAVICSYKDLISAGWTVDAPFQRHDVLFVITSVFNQSAGYDDGIIKDFKSLTDAGWRPYFRLWAAGFGNTSGRTYPLYSMSSVYQPDFATYGEATGTGGTLNVLGTQFSESFQSFRSIFSSPTANALLPPDGTSSVSFMVLYSDSISDTRDEFKLGVPAPSSAPVVRTRVKSLLSAGLTASNFSMKIKWYNEAGTEVSSTEDVPSGFITINPSEFEGYSKILITTSYDMLENGGMYTPTTEQAESLKDYVLVLTHVFDLQNGYYAAKLASGLRPVLVVISNDESGQTSFECTPYTSVENSFKTYYLASAIAQTMRINGVGFSSGYQNNGMFVSFGSYGGFWFAMLVSELDKKTTYYCSTFQTNFGEEGAPSDTSESVDVTQMHEVGVTCPSVIPDGRNIKYEHVYRVATGNSSGNFYLAKTLSENFQEEFIDDLDEASIGGALYSTGFDEPPDDLQGLVSMPGGFFAGFSGNGLYFSEVNYPHAWPYDYMVNVGAQIVALGVSGGQLIVLTDEVPYMCAGNTPDVMAVIQYTLRQACVSARGVVSAGGMLFYPSPDGYCMIGGGNAVVATADMITRDQWQAYNPTTMIAEIHDNFIYIFSDTASLVFEMLPGGGLRMTTSTVEATALYSDPSDDTLYAAVQNGDDVVLCTLNTGAPMVAKWRTKELVYTKPFAFSWARIIADDYPVRMNVYADNEQVLSLEILSAKARMLPVIKKSSSWSIEVEAPFKVTELALGTSLQEVTAP